MSGYLLSKFVLLSDWAIFMRKDNVDLLGAKAVVAAWIEGLSVSDRILPDPVRRELLDGLARAVPLIDAEGSIWFEIGALASLGFGIFRHSFHLKDAVVYVAPYLPAGLSLSAASESAVPLSVPAVKSEGLGAGRAIPFRNMGSTRSGPA